MPTYTRVIENLVLDETLSLSGHEWDNTLIRNVTIRNTNGDGITLRDVNNVRIENCTIYDTGWTGIRLAANGSSKNVTIVNNYIHDTEANGISAGEDHENLQIIGNRIHNTGLGGGPNVADHHGMYVQAPEFLIEGNYVTRSDDGNGISVRTTGVVRNNLVDSSGKSGIAYYSDHPAGPSDTLIIENNVVANSGTLVSNRDDIDLLSLPNKSYAAKNYIIRDNTITDQVDVGSGYDDIGANIDITNNDVVSVSEARAIMEQLWADGTTTTPDDPTEEPTDPTTGDQTLTGTDGDDVLNGGAGNDTLQGGAGNDTLYGDTGLDTLDGGAGDDTLRGGRDGDTFVIAQGMGNDTIVDFYPQWSDVIRLVDFGLTSFEELQPLLSQEGSDTVIALPGGQTLTLKDVSVDALTADEFAFANPNPPAEEPTEPPVAETQVLLGTDGADVIEGGAGNDFLYGDVGADTLDGGAGDDVVMGGRNADTFVVAEGMGDDTLVDFLPQWSDVIRLVGFGLSSFEELQPLLSQEGSDTVIALPGGQTLTLKNVDASTLTADEFAFDNADVAAATAESFLYAEGDGSTQLSSKTQSLQLMATVTETQDTETDAGTVETDVAVDDGPDASTPQGDDANVL